MGEQGECVRVCMIMRATRGLIVTLLRTISVFTTTGESLVSEDDLKTVVLRYAVNNDEFETDMPSEKVCSMQNVRL